MYKARVNKNFTFAKFPGKEFKKGDVIENLTDGDVAYLLNNPRGKNFIVEIEEVIEKSVVEPKVEKAVKKTTKKKK